MTFRGSDTAKGLIENGSNFLVYGDPDIDGMIAAYLVCAYLRKKGKTFDYFINENRKHGFELSPEKVSGKTIIAVDFLMSEAEVKAVVDAGATIVLIDHHHIDSSFIDYATESNRGIIISNQYSFEPENYRFLSGAGVVYYVLGYIEPEMFSEDNKALVGITLLSDVRAIESKEAIDFLKTTYVADTPMINRLKNIVKPDKVYGFGTVKMNRTFIDFSFSPKFNSLFRANKGYEALEFMLGYPLDKSFLEKCKEFQNTVINYLITHLQGEDYGHLVCKYIDDIPMQQVIRETGSDPIFEDALLSNYIGLVASHIKGSGCSLVYIRNKDGTVQRGSFRGTYDYNYLQLFRDLGGTGDGHRNAFGFYKMVDIDLQKFSDILKEMSRYVNNDDRIIEIYNLSSAQTTKNRDLNAYNTYCRTHKQIFYRYIGKPTSCDCITKTERFQLWKVDGVEVRAFDADVKPWNGYILPFKEATGYNVFYLKKEIY